jgi:hypothetical protein
MAGEPAGKPVETPTRVFYPDGGGEYRFVTAVDAQADKLVYLDFVQHNGETAETVLGIARLVMAPEVAADLLAKLSRLWDEQRGER